MTGLNVHWSTYTSLKIEHESTRTPRHIPPMPSTPLYQRVMIRNVPCWKDVAGTLYYYESNTMPTEENRIQIGSEVDGIYPDWTQRLEPLLVAYRASQKARARAPAKN